MGQPPRFRSVRKEVVPETPEALWYALAAKRTHESLRGPQQDVLRRYAEHRGDRNLALELPTGSGKTAVGLLIAEHHRRRTGKPTAYLTLTRQLAHQAIDEAGSLGFTVANLIGSVAERDDAQVGLFRTANAVAVTTYSNLFNVNPVTAGADLLILDDAHGGESAAADMWTIRVQADQAPRLYRELRAALRPALTAEQSRSLSNPSSWTAHLAHLQDQPDAVETITTLLDAETGSTRFAWGLVREHLDACAVIVSRFTITIRPLVPPTHTHSAFANATQRVFMSATIGNVAELARGYGIPTPTAIRAEYAQPGRHYIFVPETSCNASEARGIVATLWKSLPTRRALLLAPSARQADRAFEELHALCHPMPRRVSSDDIENSLEPFTQSTDSILTLTRYDGIDLPHEDCRLLVMTGTPSAVSEFEVLLRDQWRLGPVLQSREATRVLQGIGRCTRGDTDFAVVIWLGQDLADFAARAVTQVRLPDGVRSEIAWGLEQSRNCRNGVTDFVETLRLLITDQGVRSEADESIRRSEQPPTEPSATDAALSNVVDRETASTTAAWDGDWELAYNAARDVADRLGGDALAGYRAWWWYLAANAAIRNGNPDGANDCLQRARSCRINQAFLAAVSRRTAQVRPDAPINQLPANTESCWRFLTDVGWAGLGFQDFVAEMTERLGRDDHTAFHMGLEALGRMLGADVLRPTGQGDPDVVWSFPDDLHIAFEAKTEKLASSSFSKRDVMEAAGHINWMKMKVPGADQPDAVLHSIIISTARKVDEPAEPQVQGLFLIDPAELRALGVRATEFLANARANFAGNDFGSSATAFSIQLGEAGMTNTRLLEALTTRPLSSL